MGRIRKQTVGQILRNIPRDRIETAQLLSRLQDSGGQSAYATPVNWTARRKPADLESIALLGGDVSLKWVDYQLFQVGGQTFAPVQLDRIIGCTGQGYDIKLIRENQFEVIWNTHCVQLQGAPPGAPSGFSGAFTDTTHASFSWTAGSGTIDHYDLQSSTDNGVTWIDLGPIAGNLTSTTLSGLQAGTTYLFQLRARDPYMQFGPWAQIGVTPF